MKKTILFDAEALNELEAGVKNYEINLLTSLKLKLSPDWKLLLVVQKKTSNIPYEFQNEKFLALQNPIVAFLQILWWARKKTSRDGSLGSEIPPVAESSAPQKSLSPFFVFIVFMRKLLLYLFTPKMLLLKLQARFYPDHFFQIISFSDWILPGVPKAMIVYDLTNFTKPEVHVQGHSKYIRLLFENTTGKKLEKEITFLSISEQTRKDFLNFFPHVDPSRIVTVYNGIDFRLQDYIEKKRGKSALPVLEKFTINKPYIMGLGTIEPRKNIRTLIKAFEIFSQSHPEYKLVIVGKKGWDNDFENFIQSLSEPVKTRLLITGHIERTEVFVLLENADLFVYPSLYEGFGLPLLESMVLGTPAIASGNSSMPEVLGPQGIYLQNPLDFHELNALMEKVLFTKSFDKQKYIEYQKEQSKKFDWDKVSAQIIDWIT